MKKTVRCITEILTSSFYTITLLAGVILSCIISPIYAQQPNIVLILADDLGYGDLGCYNPHSLIPTPHLDQLAKEGIRFTQAYCPVSVCSPTRYALMTGRYPWRSWKKSGVMANYEPSMIDSSLLTLPEMLQQAGYTTAGFGKWHLGTTFPTKDGQQPVGYGKFRADDNGANLDLSLPVTDGPMDHGFDHWYGFSCASECWIIDNRTVTGAIDHDFYTIESASNIDHLQRYTLTEYLPHITQKSISFLTNHATQQHSSPFFLYFAPYVPHIPISVSDDFNGKTKAGLYGDYVHELDYYIGQLLNSLDSLELTDQTLILFASDNGSQFEVTNHEMDLANAPNSPLVIDTLDKPGVYHRPNWPLKGHKWSIYEGGVRTPFIARWPEHIPEEKTSNQMMGLNDLLATMAAIIDVEIPDGDQLDSHNMLPALTAKDTLNRFRKQIIVQSSRNEFAIIQDNWKYIWLGPNNSSSNTGELYNLSNDPAEQTDLHESQPEKVKELKQRLRDMIQEDINWEE